MSPLNVVIVVAVVVAVVALLVFAIIQDRKRVAELKAWCENNEMLLKPERIDDLDEQYPAFGCLQRGKDRYANNFFFGVRKDFAVCGFDFHYITETTDSEGKTQSQKHVFSAAIVHTDWQLQHLFIRPEGWFDKLTEFVGIDDIDFESHEFSRKFFVKAKEKRWAFDVLHQETIEFLLAQPRFSIEFNGEQVMVWRDSAFKAADFEAALDTTIGILQRFPKYLIRDLKAAQEDAAQ